MVTKSLLPVLTFALLLGAGGVSAASPSAQGFPSVLGRYEAIRQALAADTTAGIAAHAAAIEKEARALAAGFTPERAGMAAARAADGAALLPEVAAAAAKLAKARDLAAARAAFGDLSRPMVRWRDMATGSRPAVAFCSMANRPWLQPQGALGNPYYGKSMLRCGEVVSKAG